jgi:hypothetical protein
LRTSGKIISLVPPREKIAGLPAAKGVKPYRPLAMVLEGANLLGKSTL